MNGLSAARKISLVTVLILLSPIVEVCLAQSTSPAEQSQTGVVLVKLSPPVYPPIAQTANIQGDVNVMLGIRRDGSVESIAVVSGPPLLHRAALDSAQASQFECRGCSEPVTSYSLIYTFRIGDTGCCEPPTAARVTQSQNHVTVIGQPRCLCGPPEKVRSAKCLYLRKCVYPH
jgi:hypothetical protein